MTYRDYTPYKGIYMSNYEQQTLTSATTICIENGQLLYEMRNNGTSDSAARELLETCEVAPFTQYQWDMIQYHADMLCEYYTAKYDGYDVCGEI